MKHLSERSMDGFIQLSGSATFECSTATTDVVVECFPSTSVSHIKIDGLVALPVPAGQCEDDSKHDLSTSVNR